MVTLRNITNAFVKVEHDGRTFLADPWVSEGIFDGGWSPYPPIRRPEAALRACDYLYISHIHEDHSDLQAIARLPRHCQIVIPNIFPNHLIQQRVAALGFAHILMLDPLTPTPLAPDVTVEVIPPLNSFGQEKAWYDTELEPVAIDSGLLLSWAGVRILLMNDNTPYDLRPLRPVQERLKGCDLLAVNYNGVADDYPVCYRDLSEQEKVRICQQRDAEKLEANNQLITLLQPKAVLAYSSEFSVCGPQAHAFAKIRTGLYNDKTLMAAHLATHHGLPAFALFEDDCLELDPTGSRTIPGPTDHPTVTARAEVLYSAQPNYMGRFPVVGDLGALRRDAKRAAEHLFRYLERHRWHSEWIVDVRLTEDDQPLWINLQAQQTHDGSPPNGPQDASVCDRRVLFRRVDSAVIPLE